MSGAVIEAQVVQASGRYVLLGYRYLCRPIGPVGQFILRGLPAANGERHYVTGN